MIESKFYNNSFFKEQEKSSYLSGKKIIPLIVDLFHPKSVVDIGCGIGNWLNVWANEFKIVDFLGVDGPYVDPKMLMIPEENVLFFDLKKPLVLKRRFDLAMSLEVAEHIDPSCSEIFVSNLTNLSDIIVFSAAIPNQEGTNHINEQNPEYWAKIFKKQGYEVFDYFRKTIWNDKEINYWYRQNILLFIKKEKVSQFPELETCATLTDPEFLLRIHPELVVGKMTRLNQMESIPGYFKLKLYELKIGLRKLFN